MQEEFARAIFGGVTSEARALFLDGRAWLEKAAWLALCLAIAIGGYYTIARGQDPTSPVVAEHTRLVVTAIDRATPFLPIAQFVYGAIYTIMILPMLTVHDRALFRRVSLAYVFVLLSSFVVFATFPVTTKGFRPEIAAIDTSSLWAWGVALNYHCDPPMNCLPSLHLSVAFTAALCTWKADRASGRIALALASAIGVSTMLVKQHYLYDALAGTALGFAGFAAIVRPFPRSEPPPAAEVEAARVGLALYAVLYALVVFGLCGTLWAIGYAPWR